MAAGAKKELLTILRLDDVDFKSKLSKDQKQLLGFSATVDAMGVAMVAVAKATADYEVETLKAAKAAGQSVESFSAMRHVADVAGVSIEDLSKSTRKLISPTADMEKNLKRFGVSFRGSTGAMKSQEEILADLSKKYKALPSDADSAALAVTAFGEDGAKMTSVLSQNIGELTKQAQAMGRVVSQQAAESAARFSKNVNILTGSITGFRNGIGDSIIQMINQSGVLEKLSSLVQSATAWWKGLDERTRSFIVSSAAIAAGIGVITTAVIGFIAVMPPLNAALLVTVATTATLTGGLMLFAGAVAYVATHADRFQNTLKTIQSMLSSVGTEAEKAVTPFANLATAFAKLLPSGGSIAEKFKDIDVVATSIKASFAPLIISFLALSSAVRILVNSFVYFGKVAMEVGTILKNVGTIAMNPFKDSTVQDKAIVESGKRILSATKDMGQNVVGIFADMGEKSGQVLGDIITKKTKDAVEKIDTGLKKTNLGPTVSTEDAFAGINNDIIKIVESAGKAADASQNLAQRLEGVKGAVSGLGSMAVDMMKNFSELENVRFKNFTEHMNFQVGAFKAFMDMELAAFTARIDAELAEIDRQKAAIEAEEEAHQQRLKEIRDKYAKDRKAELDAELQGEFERMQKDFEIRIAAIEDTNQTEMEKEADKVQALADLEDAKNQLMLQANERLSRDMEDKKKEDDAQDKARADQKKQREEDLAKRQKELEDQKTAAAEAAAKKKDDLEKASKLIEWKAGKQAFEIAKQAQIMQAVVGMLMGGVAIAQAAAMIVASMGGVPGIPVAAAFVATAGTLLAVSGATAIQTASSQQYPPPPVFAAGGIGTRASIFAEKGPMGNIGPFRGRELAIPLNRPGGDFEALKNTVAEELTSGVRGGMMTNIEEVNIYNQFAERDDAADIAERMNEEFYEKVLTAVP